MNRSKLRNEIFDSSRDGNIIIITFWFLYWVILIVLVILSLWFFCLLSISVFMTRGRCFKDQASREKKRRKKQLNTKHKQANKQTKKRKENVNVPEHLLEEVDKLLSDLLHHLAVIELGVGGRGRECRVRRKNSCLDSRLLLLIVLGLRFRLLGFGHRCCLGRGRTRHIPSRFRLFRLFRLSH